MKKIIIKLWLLISFNLSYSMEKYEFKNSLTNFSLKSNVMNVFTTFFIGMPLLTHGASFLRKNNFLQNNNCTKPMVINDFINRFPVKIVNAFDEQCTIPKNNYQSCFVDSYLQNFGSFCVNNNGILCNPNNCEIKSKSNGYILDGILNNIPCVYNISVDSWLSRNNQYKLIVKKSDKKISESCENPRLNNNCKNAGIFNDPNNIEESYNGKFCFIKNNNNYTSCDFVNNKNQLCVLIKQNDIKIKGTFLNGYNDIRESDTCNYSDNLQKKITIFFEVFLSFNLALVAIQIIMILSSYFYRDAIFSKNEFTSYIASLDKNKEQETTTSKLQTKKYNEQIIDKQVKISTSLKYNYRHRNILNYFDKTLLVYELVAFLHWCVLLGCIASINESCKGINLYFIPTLSGAFVSITKLSGFYCHKVKFFEKGSSETFYFLTNIFEGMCLIYLLINQ